LLSDNASYYKSKKFSQFLKNLNIEQKFSSVFNPTGNSLSERINSDILLVFKIYKGWNLGIIKLIIETKSTDCIIHI
ncbi:hypothetical protein M153_280460001, partial [Pseudoloma neurophilia]